MPERRILLATIGLSILCGCTGQRPNQTAETTPAPASTRSEPGRTERAATKNGAIVLEGSEEPITFKLFDSEPAALPVAFTTYIPEDMIAEPAGSGAQKAIRFVAKFGGTREGEAYLEVSFHPPETAEPTARLLLQSTARDAASSKEKSAADKRFKWSLAEYPIVSGSKARGRIVGVAALGRHGDRLFQVTLHYPEEFADGFVPRAYRILEEWRWKDTNQGL